MNQEVKTRIWNYFKSTFLTMLLALLLTHGPHGGWVFGFLAALFLGFTVSATIWLLDFKWYWNLACSLLIVPVTLWISIAIVKMVQFENNEILSEIIDCLIISIVFIAFIESANAIARRLLKRKQRY